MSSQRDPSLRMSGVANVFIKNLDKSIDSEALGDTFSAFGNILSCKVVCDENGSKGFGFVCFSSPEEAANAITKMNRRIVGSKPLYVAMAQKKEDRKAYLTNQYMQHVAGMRALPANAILNQFHPAAGGYLVPEIPQAEGRPPYYTPNQLAQMRPNPHWQQGRRPQGFQGVPSALRQSGPRTALRHLAPTGSECPDHLAMDFGGAGATQQGLTDSCQSGGIPTAVPNLVPGAAVASAAAPMAEAPYKYASNVRSPHPAIQPLPAPQPAVHVQGQEPLTASMLAAVPPQEQKQMLGVRLYPLIQTTLSNMTGKITGMLLEMDNSELLHMLESPESLRFQVGEAVAVLHAYHANKEAAQKVGTVAAATS
ncbi:polyadenylate-binding protein 4-like [Mastomys coucha]|uniref:polyadenylate-binding protein 4-like n=1 Tax=Mastomys coucha TaxID=35658 RepID=UPI0012613EDD|nr:polyadenylate-binding protein 4-like [Mastomys coucha]